MPVKMWLPEIVRSQPLVRFKLEYGALQNEALAPELMARRLIEAVSAAHATSLTKAGPLSWRFTLPHSTRVFGIIARQLEETVDVAIIAKDPVSRVLRLVCVPEATHQAHAVGMAGVLILSVAAWLTGGVVTGIPAGIATAAAGSMWAVFTREMAMQALGNRLRRLTEDLGRALWPEAPAQVLPIQSPLL